MKSIFKISLLLISFSFVSCEKLIQHPEPGTDNLSLFNEYSQLCIEKFGLEDVKGIDLAELADSIRPHVTSDLSEEELFDLMGLFVDRMQEGHTSLKSIDFDFNKSYYWFIGYPLGMNLGIVRANYYGVEANPDVQIIAPPEALYEILYGYLPQDKEIGYIHVLSFDLAISDAELETMMSYLKDAKGIIIDVRSNIGGYMELVARLASYFTESEVVMGTNYIKNGPGKEEFAASKMIIKPADSPYINTGPVVVLQDRVTFSSGSLFCVAMNAMENTTTMGIRFGGGTGEIMDGILANGWHWTLSTSNLVDTEGRPTDPGIEPDIPMLLNPEDTNTDAIIERAILELQ